MVESAKDDLVNRLVTEPLARTRLFRSVDRGALNQIASRTVRLTHRKGDVIVRQGEPGDRLFIIIEGAADVFITSAEDKREEVVLTRLGPSDTFGEMTLLDGESRSASVRATTAMATFALDRDAIRELMRVDPALSEAMIQSLIHTIRRLTSHTADAVFFDVHQRVASLILDLARERTGADEGIPELDVHRTENEIADVLGRSRETVAEVLRAFERMGYLEFQSHVIRVLNPDALRQQMNGEMTWSALANTSLHDPLTRLANRRLFGERVAAAVSRSQRQATAIAVLCIDIDDFKGVNNTHGHTAGDQILGAMADRLRKYLRASDTAARFGGDQFGVLLEDITDPADVLVTTRRILAQMNVPLVIPGITVTVTASVGVTITEGPDQLEPAALLRQADVAMYRAKQAGTGTFALYDKSVEAAPR